MVGPSRADPGTSRHRDLGDLSFSKVLGSFGDHRLIHHWRGRPGARDRTFDTAPSHRATTRLATFRSTHRGGASFASGRIGPGVGHPHVERDGFRCGGLYCRSHDLSVNSRTGHRAKVVRDVGARAARVGHCPCCSAPKASANFARSLTYGEWSSISEFERPAHAVQTSPDSATLRVTTKPSSKSRDEGNSERRARSRIRASTKG